MDRELHAVRGLRAAFPHHPRLILHVVLAGDATEYVASHLPAGVPGEVVIDTTKSRRVLWMQELRHALGFAPERRVSRRTAIALGATSVAAVATTALAATFYAAPPPATSDPFRPAGVARTATPEPSALRVRWRYSLGFSAPTVAGSAPADSQVGLAADATAVYTISPSSQVLRAQSVRDGTLLWRFPTAETASVTSLIGSFIVHAGTDRLLLLAEINAGSALKLMSLDKATGKVFWQSAAIGQSFAFSDLCVADGAIFFQNEGKLYGYSQDGHLLWPPLTLFPSDLNHTPTFEYYSTSAFANGLLYLGLFNGTLTAISAATGRVVWSTPVTSGQSGTAKLLSAQLLQMSPAVATGLVYIGASDGYLYALDAATGAARWKAQLVKFGQTFDEFAVMSVPVIAGDVVYLQAGTSDGVSMQQGTLCAVQAHSGKVLWQIDPTKLSLPQQIPEVTAIPNFQPAYVSGETVYWTTSLLSTDTNQLGFQAFLGLHQRDGSLQAYYLAPIGGISPLSVFFPSSPVPVPGGIAFLSNEPTIYVLDM
jgi:outer membrane protein assembly factor BamB